MFEMLLHLERQTGKWRQLKRRKFASPFVGKTIIKNMNVAARRAEKGVANNGILCLHYKLWHHVFNAKRTGNLCENAEIM